MSEPDDAAKRREIAIAMPSAAELDLLVGPPPQEWLAEEWDDNAQVEQTQREIDD